MWNGKTDAKKILHNTEAGQRVARPTWSLFFFFVLFSLVWSNELEVQLNHQHKLFLIVSLLTRSIILESSFSQENQVYPVEFFLFFFFAQNEHFWAVFNDWIWGQVDTHARTPVGVFFYTGWQKGGEEDFLSLFQQSWLLQ